MQVEAKEGILRFDVVFIDGSGSTHLSRLSVTFEREASLANTGEEQR